MSKDQDQIAFDYQAVTVGMTEVANAIFNKFPQVAHVVFKATDKNGEETKFDTPLIFTKEQENTSWKTFVEEHTYVTACHREVKPLKPEEKHNFTICARKKGDAVLHCVYCKLTLSKGIPATMDWKDAVTQARLAIAHGVEFEIIQHTDDPEAFGAGFEII